jgi:hypothetical protein
MKEGGSTGRAILGPHHDGNDALVCLMYHAPIIITL